MWDAFEIWSCQVSSTEVWNTCWCSPGLREGVSPGDMCGLSVHWCGRCQGKLVMLMQRKWGRARNTSIYWAAKKVDLQRKLRSSQRGRKTLRNDRCQETRFFLTEKNAQQLHSYVKCKETKQSPWTCAAWSHCCVITAGSVAAIEGKQEWTQKSNLGTVTTLSVCSGFPQFMPAILTY